MQYYFQVTSMFAVGKHTATAGTRIRALLHATRGLFTYLTFLRYTAAATAHTLTVMRGQTHARAAAAASAGATDVIVTLAMLDGAGNALAANDLVSMELNDLSWHLGVVSAWDGGTKTITLTGGTAIPAGYSVPVNAQVISYGIASDTNHATLQFTAPQSATTDFPAEQAGILARSNMRGEPLIVDSDNATNAGTLELAVAACGR